MWSVSGGVVEVDAAVLRIWEPWRHCSDNKRQEHASPFLTKASDAQVGCEHLNMDVNLDFLE